MKNKNALIYILSLIVTFPFIANANSGVLVDLLKSDLHFTEICSFKGEQQIEIDELPKEEWNKKTLLALKCLNIDGQVKIYDKLADIALNASNPEIRFLAIGTLRDRALITKKYFPVFIQAVNDSDRGVGHIASTYFQTLRDSDPDIHRQILEQLIQGKEEIIRIHLAEFFIYEDNKINSAENFELLITAFLAKTPNGEESSGTRVQIIKALKLNFSFFSNELIEYLSTYFSGSYDDKDFYVKDILKLIERHNVFSETTMLNIIQAIPSNPSKGNDVVAFSEVTSFLEKRGVLDSKLIDILVSYVLQPDISNYERRQLFYIIAKQPDLDVTAQLKIVKLLDNEKFNVALYVEGYFIGLNTLDSLVINEIRSFIESGTDFISEMSAENILEKFD